MIAALRYSHDKKTEWDQFIRAAKNGLFIFYRDYMDYHAGRFADASLMFYLDQRLIAVMPANLRGNVFFSHEGLTFGGMVYGSGMRAALMLDLINCVRQSARELGAGRMVYKAIPFPFWRGPSQEDLYALHWAGATLARRDLSAVVHLRDRPSLSKGRAHSLAKAGRAGLTVTEDATFAPFMPVLAAALARHGATPVHTLAELELLAARFPENIRLATAIDRSGAVLAGAVEHDYGQAVHTQYMASSDAGREAGALDLVVASLLDRAAAAGKQYFSFGASTEEEGRVLNVGLAAQKEMFGGRAIVLDHYALELNQAAPAAHLNASE